MPSIESEKFFTVDRKGETRVEEKKKEKRAADPFGEALDNLFESEDPHCDEIVKITSETNDPKIVEEYLRENEKDLSPEAKHFLAESIRRKRKREKIKENIEE